MLKGCSEPVRVCMCVCVRVCVCVCVCSCVHARAKSLQLCLNFSALWTVARQGPPSMKFSRQEYWNGLPCPPQGDLPDPEIEPASLVSPALAGRFFTTSATWETLGLASVQFSSVAQAYPTICDPMNRSTPGLSVHHKFPEFTQTHVNRVGDAIQPSHPLSSPSPPAPNPSQHRGIFK